VDLQRLKSGLCTVSFGFGQMAQKFSNHALMKLMVGSKSRLCILELDKIGSVTEVL
jgi:hypothetical protein